MVHPRPRRRPGENRERLIEAGIDEFGTRGYHGASTQRIARRAGVPQPHLYTNFSTKRELFLACVSRVASAVGTGPASSTVDAASLTLREQRFLYQCFAAACDDALGAELLPVLQGINGGGPGERTLLQTWLANAATSYLEPEHPLSLE